MQINKTLALKSAMHVPLIVYEMTKASAALTRSLVSRKVYAYDEVDFFTQPPPLSDMAIDSVHNKQTLLKLACGLSRDEKETFLYTGVLG
jgi:hypothetical protein